MISVILPAYNEEENIKRIPKELIPYMNKIKKKYNENFEIIIVNDGSKDNTLNISQKLKSKYKFFFVFSHRKNMGLGKAIRTGIKNSKGDILITLDSDFTFHPKLIIKLLKEYKEKKADCVIGSPYLYGYSKNIPKYRILLSYFCNLIYSILLSRRLTAVSPIFRIYNGKLIRKLKLESLGFEINAEILIKLLENNAKIIEVPAKLTNRKYGVSKINNIKQIKNHLKIYGKIIKWKIKNFV